MKTNLKYSLRFVSGNLAGKTVAMDYFPFVLGRSSDSDLLLPDERASRKHAMFEMVKHSLYLVDLESRNGVTVNGKTITRHRIEDNDEIQIGFSIFVVESFETKPKMERLTPLESEISAAPNPSNDHAANELPRSEPSLEPEAKKSTLPHLSNLSLDIFQLKYGANLTESVAQQILDFFHQNYSEIEFLQLDCLASKSWTKAISKRGGRHAVPRSIPTVNASDASSPFIQINSNTFLFPHPNLQSTYSFRFFLQLVDPPVANFMEQLLSQLSTALLKLEHQLMKNELAETAKQWSKVERYLSADLAKMIQNQKIDLTQTDLSVQEVYGTILFTDIQGFTRMSEQMEPTEISELLNEYFKSMVQVIGKNHGFINKFIGDAIMVLFGVPHQDPSHVPNAVQCGIEMIQALKQLHGKLEPAKRFNMRVGINTGNFVAGNIGAYDRMEYTVIGDTVNLASRLEGASQANQITIGEETAKHIPQGTFELSPLPPLNVKGKSKPVKAYTVLF